MRDGTTSSSQGSSRPGPADPAEIGVEQQERHEAEPEHRHRIAEQPDNAQHMVGPSIVARRRDDARRHAEHQAEKRRERRELDGRGEETARCPSVTGLRVRAERPKSPCSHHPAIARELDPDRPVQSHLGARAGIDRARGAVADHRQHRIDRHHSRDEEGDQQQSQERQADSRKKPGKPCEHAASIPCFGATINDDSASSCAGPTRFALRRAALHAAANVLLTSAYSSTILKFASMFSHMGNVS